MEEAIAVRPLTPLLESVRKPISDATPAGIDVTYEDVFQQLKGEINKLSSASGGADYDRMVELGTRILNDHSKDLNAACYLAIGLCRTRGWEGAAEGFAAVRHVMEAFWEDLFPVKRRMAARRNALQFLLERLGDWMEAQKPGPPDREAVAWAQEEVEALQALAMEQMEDEAPAFSLVLRVLREHLRRLPDPDAAPPPAADAPAPGGDGAPAPSAMPPSTPQQPAAAAPTATELASPEEAARQVYRIAAYMREQSALDPVPFRLARVVRFSGLAQAPPNDAGKTMIEPPPQERRSALAGMFNQGNYAFLVQQAEEALLESGMHFWLDLQRLLAGALAALGVPARPAHQAVVEEAASLVRRIPELPKLTFADGTPFADPVTAAWLAEIAASDEGAGEPAGERDEALEADIEKARSLAEEGNLAGALRQLTTQSGPPRAAFRRRLVAAELCFKAGRPEVARPLLEALDEIAEQHRLQGWEPALTLSMFRQLHRCYNTLETKAPAADKAALRQQADDVFKRLCRLDPAAALA